MKRKVLIVLAVAAVLLVAGCAFDKSYHVLSGDSSTGMCMQVTSNNSDIQNALTLAGYQDGTCAANGFSGAHYCTYSAGSGTTSYDISIYWGTSYATAAAVETACTQMGWTYH
jgi:hypothetical protein